MNQGYVYECLNFAQVFRLPLVLVCENNGYGEYTAMDAVTAGKIAARAEAMEIPALIVDGMDVWAVRATAEEAAGRVRRGDGPVFVEARTYRFVGHSRSDPGKYRKPGELERWQERDPLLVGRQRLIEDCGLSPDAADAVDIEIEREMTEVVERALAAPYPDPSQPATAYKP